MAIASLVMVLVAVLAGCETSEPAESSSVATVAFLRSVPSPDASAQDALVAELARQGYVVGDNLLLLGEDPGEVHRGQAEITEVVGEWLGQGVDLIVALSTSGAQAAARAAPETTVLFLSNDPVAAGLVQDESRPEGRLTGATFRVPADRTLSVASRAVPDLERLGFVFPPGDPATASIRTEVEVAAADLDIDLVVAPFEEQSEVGPAVASLREEGVQAVLLANSPTSVQVLPALEAALDEVGGLPLIANTRAVPNALLVLEPDVRRLYTQLGAQAARLLRGVPVQDVPVEDPARFRLVLNASVAGRLGIDLPTELLEEADEVIGLN